MALLEKGLAPNLAGNFFCHSRQPPPGAHGLAAALGAVQCCAYAEILASVAAPHSLKSALASPSGMIAASRLRPTAFGMQNSLAACTRKLTLNGTMAASPSWQSWRQTPRGKSNEPWCAALLTQARPPWPHGTSGTAAAARSAGGPPPVPHHSDAEQLWRRRPGPPPAALPPPARCGSWQYMRCQAPALFPRLESYTPGFVGTFCGVEL